MANIPWLSPNSFDIPKNIHPFPRCVEKVLSRIDPDKKKLAEDHVNKFMLAIRLLNVEHEDIVCKLFPFTFEGKYSTWYLSLTPRSIHNWEYFQATFLGKFGDEKTPSKLVLELSKIKMHPKEKVKDFNQRFLTLINKVPLTSKPTNDVTAEFYTTTISPSTTMFIKRAEKEILNENFEKVIKVEKDLLSMHGKTKIDDEKPSASSNKTANQTKTSSDKKRPRIRRYGSMSKNIKKLSNDVINLKKMAFENTSRNISKPSFRCYGNLPHHPNS